MDELNFGGRPFKKGAPKSLGVRRVQEWLCLHGFAVAIDNDFGDATEKAVKRFNGSTTCLRRASSTRRRTMR
jgi:hypothetical protein